MRAKYVMSEVFLGLWRNISMTVAMIITMAVSLSMLGAGLLMYQQVDLIEEYYQTNLEVVMYLDQDLDEEVRDQLHADLRQDGRTDQVLYEDQDEAWERFQETFSDNTDMIGLVDPEVLPAAFRISMQDITEADDLIADFIEREGIYDATNQREVLATVFDILGGAQNMTLIIALVQGIAALMLVANTIQVAAYSRRREVSIMKLVGAPNWFVQAPFVLEAMFAGVIGAVVAFATLCAAKVFVIDGAFANLFDLMPPLTWNSVLLVLPVLLAVASLISAVTAWVTLRFNIKV